MEAVVKVVGGIDNCFVSLPLPLIHALQTTAAGPLPPVLALELRSRSGASWHLAWSGSASMSSAIELSSKFAECISLHDGTTVQVKAVSNITRAEVVTIEPRTEDDWEILELNAELAEEAILQQVGIVYEGMRFPLWLHGHTVVRFLVISISPIKSIVQLVPRTKVSVAPKMRQGKTNLYQELHNQNSVREHTTAKALLRIQAENKRHIHWFEFKGFELGVVLTSVAFVHPETAHKLLLDNLQFVTIMPRFAENEIIENGHDNTHKGGSNTLNKEENKVLLMPGKETSRKIVVCILYSDSVAKGHIMLPQSLRLLLRAYVHSWVYVKKCHSAPQKEMPSMKLCPCRFELSLKSSPPDNNGLNVMKRETNLKSKSISSRTDVDTNVADWSVHDEFLTSLHSIFTAWGSEDTSSYNTSQDMKFLIDSWITGQLKAIGSHANEMEINSIILSKETLLHFEVKNFTSMSKKNVDAALEMKRNSRESAVELLFLLTTAFWDDSSYPLPDTYELTLKVEQRNGDQILSWRPETGKLEIGNPIFFDCVGESNPPRNHNLTVSSLSWLKDPITEVIDRLIVLLSLPSRKLLSTFDLPLPGHILIYGPSGSGKTSLAMAVAKHFEEHEGILAHTVFINCSKLAPERSQIIRQAIMCSVSEALKHSPSIVIFDNLDSIVSFSSEADGVQPSSSVTSLMKFLTDIMDEYGEKSLASCGYGPIVFMASVQSLGNLPQPLASSGRFDFHIQLPAPAATERGAILKHEICKRALHCPEDILSEIASKCEGYDAYDLLFNVHGGDSSQPSVESCLIITSESLLQEILVDRAMRAAFSRFLPTVSAESRHEMNSLAKEDFLQAMQDFVPVAMRGLTKAASEGGRCGWDDVGGLSDIRNVIQEMIELPSKFPSIFAQSPLRLRSNVLLYGPPGCGKTHIVGAAAAACSLRFISIKGPELLNKYIGASEQAVRDLFSKASAAAPCLLFFDEFDSIAPKRGHDNTGVTDRVVNQLLTELDGVESLTGVFVFAATNRPDLLDAALLRPGRLDRLLFCDFPTWQERLDILTVLSRKLSLASNVNLGTIASMTEGFSGADLQALLSDAQLASVHELLDSKEDNKPGRMPVISDELLKSVTSRARPSVSDAERHKLNGIYSQFLVSRKSVTAQSREGKRATLA